MNVKCWLVGMQPYIRQPGHRTVPARPGRPPHSSFSQDCASGPTKWLGCTARPGHILGTKNPEACNFCCTSCVCVCVCDVSLLPSSNQ